MRMSFGSLVSEGRLQFSDGYRTKGSELSSAGFRILRAGDIQNGQPVFDSPDFVRENLAPGIGAKTVQVGDVVLTTKGTVGRTALIKEAPESPAVYSPQLCFFRPDSRVLLPRYLYFWFSSPEFRHQSSSLQSSTDMAPYISLSQLHGVTISLPAPSTQQAIAEVLGALDDKIAANTAILAKTLTLGTAIKRQSEGGMISAVADIAEFHNRKRVPLSAKQRGEHRGSIPYWGANGQLDTVDEALFDEPLVLVGEDGTVMTNSGTAVVHHVWGPSWVNNHAHVLTGKGVSTELLYFVMKDLEVASAVTGAVQPKLSMGNLKKLQVHIPAPSQLPRVQEQLDSLLAYYRSVSDESRILAQLRDTLLPALMDGRLRVRDAIAQVEEAV